MSGDGEQVLVPLAVLRALASPLVEELFHRGRVDDLGRLARHSMPYDSYASERWRQHDESWRTLGEALSATRRLIREYEGRAGLPAEKQALVEWEEKFSRV